MKSTRLGVVYFIGAASGDGLIKIGFSSEPADRLFSMQASCPVRLEMLAYIAGSHMIERKFHARHDAGREYGEWFNRTADLMSDITAIRSGIFNLKILPEPFKRKYWGRPPDNPNENAARLRVILSAQMIATPMHDQRKRDYIVV